MKSNESNKLNLDKKISVSHTHTHTRKIRQRTNVKTLNDKNKRFAFRKQVCQFLRDKDNKSNLIISPDLVFDIFPHSRLCITN